MATTTSTTTTTTTINGVPIGQESSRGDIIDNGGDTTSTPSTTQTISTPGISNIFQTTIKPSNIDILSTNQAADQTTSEVANGMGYIPIVWYNAYQIDAENISFFSLYDDGIAPCMKVSFVDTLGIMKDKAFPLDDTKITLFMSSRSDQLKPIFMQFKIRDFSNNNGELMIDSTMDVDGLYIKSFKSYPNMTSSQALQTMCKDIGLGFNTNISDTNDSMTWLNCGDRPYDFMEEVVDHGYISDQSFLIGYIDHYYNFNYVDIQKELSRDISSELGIVSSGVADILKIADSNNANIGRLLLTNDESLSGQNIFFESFRILNSSTSTSLENGYRDDVKYYDLNDKSLLLFTINSITNNDGKSIILKGAPQDETFFNNNTNYYYAGRLDSSNTHKNYHYSPTHNNRNIIDSQKVGMEVQLPTPNYNIYKYQKIKVLLSSNTPTPASPMINQRLTGDWQIIDIKFTFFNKTIKQIVTLVKRELELSDEELNNESQSTSNVDTGTRGSYDNPDVNNPTYTPAGSNTRNISSNSSGIIGANNYTSTNLLPNTSWQNIAANFIAGKEGFLSTAKFDTNSYRGGYGSDQKLVNGSLVKVTSTTTFTQTEAINTLSYLIQYQYGPEISSNIGSSLWNKLSNNQKAALCSLGYNAGTSLTSHSYGQTIQSGIQGANYQQAATGIENGPKTANGQYLSSLATRRQQEASLFLS